MPRVAMNYQNTIIYKIVCKDISITDCYVGSTTNFTKRKCQHKTSCNNINDKAYKVNVYVFIRANYGWENWDMIEVEKFPCNDKNEALKRERYWIETLKATLNIKKPLRTKKEHRKDNPDKIKEYKKRYADNNAEKIREYQKQYNKNNIDKIKEGQKQYVNKHDEELKEYKKKYDKEHSEKIKEYKRQYYLNKKKKQME
jgi:hypothetical protein